MFLRLGGKLKYIDDFFVPHYNWLYLHTFQNKRDSNLEHEEDNKAIRKEITPHTK